LIWSPEYLVRSTYHKALIYVFFSTPVYSFFLGPNTLMSNKHKKQFSLQIEMYITCVIITWVTCFAFYVKVQTKLSCVTQAHKYLDVSTCSMFQHPSRTVFSFFQTECSYKTRWSLAGIVKKQVGTLPCKFARQWWWGERVETKPRYIFYLIK
jgi:uncharacterized membrane protein YciS (DUF1049 family)